MPCAMVRRTRRRKRRRRAGRQALPFTSSPGKGARPKSGIEALARDARYGLMGRWLKRHRVANLYVGHTLDDQAETFLLRLGRGSGLDGLSAMRALAPFPVQGFEDLNLARPLLGIGRADLRNYLKEHRQ